MGIFFRFLKHAFSVDIIIMKGKKHSRGDETRVYNDYICHNIYESYCYIVIHNTRECFLATIYATVYMWHIVTYTDDESHFGDDSLVLRSLSLSLSLVKGYKSLCRHC